MKKILSIVVILSGILLFTFSNDIKINNTLPSINNVNIETQPMLYDFMNGSLGKYYDEDFSDYGFFLALLYDESNPSFINTSYYSYGEGVVFPILGTSVKTIEIDDIELFISNANKVDIDRTFIEEQNTLYILPVDDNSKDFNNYVVNGEWAGITLMENEILEHGMEYQSIYVKGDGWSTEWCRKEPYSSYIEQFAYVDINNEFWDRYSYHSVKEYVCEDFSIKVKVINNDYFEVIYSDGNKINANERIVKEIIEHDNLTLVE